MEQESRKRIVLISTFPPDRCGIATFTSDLLTSMSTAAAGQVEPLIVTIRPDPAIRYSDPVKFEIRRNVRNDYICAADYINFSHVDVASVQHEFGLFGGDAGSYLGPLLRRLKAPIVTTLHTVLEKPQPNYYRSMMEVCERSDLIITMNERGVDMLRDIYGIDEKKIRLIPHGIPDLSFVDTNYYKQKLGLEGRRTILTFGLLSRNKGIEVMLNAMPEIIKAKPDVVYIILGMTHPVVLKREGESYRFKLQQIVKSLRLEDHVIFYNRFVDDVELQNWLCAADIYVTPYLNKEQLTSGTLAFAVGTGKVVVSTPYWAAEELLADGRGRLVPFGDSGRLAAEIISVLADDATFYALRGAAYDYGRLRTWPRIGQVYWELINQIRATHMLPVPPVAAGAAEPSAEIASTVEVPEPMLDHLTRLTDDTGLIQHSKFTVPQRTHGYCTDDNARALMAMTKYYQQYPDAEALRLFDIYLSFVLYAQNPDGTIRNFLEFNRQWRDQEPAHDAFGRTLWALGTVIAHPPLSAYLSVVKDCFDRSVPHVDKQSPRGRAYSILGLCDYLKMFPGASDIKRQLELTAESLLKQYETNSAPDWPWFEDRLTYDNAVLPHALFAAAMFLDDRRCSAVAQQSADFLLQVTYTGDHFSFVGSNGWYEKGKPRATFDQQPIDAAATVLMLRAAYEAGKDPKHLALQRKAFDWFLGANDLHLPLYDFQTKGCSDGLMAGGTNGNQGAESTVSFLTSLLSVIESDAIADRTAARRRVPIVSAGSPPLSATRPERAPRAAPSPAGPA